MRCNCVCRSPPSCDGAWRRPLPRASRILVCRHSLAESSRRQRGIWRAWHTLPLRLQSPLLGFPVSSQMHYPVDQAKQFPHLLCILPRTAQIAHQLPLGAETALRITGRPQRRDLGTRHLHWQRVSSTHSRSNLSTSLQIGNLKRLSKSASSNRSSRGRQLAVKSASTTTVTTRWSKVQNKPPL